MIQPDPILQSHLPIAAWMDARTARLPGTLPVEGDACCRATMPLRPRWRCATA